jgi:hypothetical protein
MMLIFVIQIKGVQGLASKEIMANPLDPFSGFILKVGDFRVKPDCKNALETSTAAARPSEQSLAKPESHSGNGHRSPASKQVVLFKFLRC